MIATDLGRAAILLLIPLACAHRPAADRDPVRGAAADRRAQRAVRRGGHDVPPLAGRARSASSKPTASSSRPRRRPRWRARAWAACWSSLIDARLRAARRRALVPASAALLIAAHPREGGLRRRRRRARACSRRSPKGCGCDRTPHPPRARGRSATTILFGHMFMAVYVLYMTRDLGLGAMGVGLVFATGGVGLARRLRRRRHPSRAPRARGRP